MNPFELFEGHFSLPELAEALLAQDPITLQAVYTSLPDDRRDAIGAAILDTGPLDSNRLRHLKAVCASATLPAVLTATTSVDPELARDARDVVERLAFADPSLAAPILAYYDRLVPSAQRGWIRILGTLGTPDAVENLRQLQGPDAPPGLAEELGRLGHLTSSKEAEAKRALQTGLTIREEGRTIRADELSLLLTHRKLALVWQLLDTGQIPPTLHPKLTECSTLAQSKSERRFARKIVAALRSPEI